MRSCSCALKSSSHSGLGQVSTARDFWVEGHVQSYDNIRALIRLASETLFCHLAVKPFRRHLDAKVSRHQSLPHDPKTLNATSTLAQLMDYVRNDFCLQTSICVNPGSCCPKGPSIYPITIYFPKTCTIVTSTKIRSTQL